jgi:hypothetical protein
MVRAILEDRKTQTRRVIKPQPPEGCTVGWSAFSGKMKIECRSYTIPHQSFIKVPYGKRGDRLWVKESHRLLDCTCTETCRTPGHVWYEADQSGYHGASLTRLRPSIHMPRWASRITLEIEIIRVERLQSISGPDAQAEGWPREQELYPTVNTNSKAQDWYRRLWNKINGEGSWTANPWVWVITFKKISNDQAH